MSGIVGDKPILSIDWDQRTLRLVHGRAGRKAVKIDQVLSVPIPAEVRLNEAESLGSFIGQAVSKAGIKTRRAAVDIPREQINFYTLKLPNASVSDLAGMVAFQIPKELPFPVDHAVVDFTAPQARGGETIDVLVAAVRKEVLAFYTEVFERAGLKLQRVGLRANANQFAVNAMLAATPHENVLFVDVGPRTTEIDVLHKGQLVFSRAADVVIPDIVESADAGRAVAPEQTERPLLSLVSPTEPPPSLLAKAVRDVMIEVTRSIEAYRSVHSGATIEHAVIGGSCAIEEALAEAIEKQYRITAQPYNPAVCFGWEADRGAAAGAFASTLGLVLAQLHDVQLHINFLEPKRPISRAERQFRKAPLAAATAVLFVAAGVVFYLMMVKPEYDAREQLRREIAEAQKVLDQHKEFAQIVGVVRDHEKNAVVWIDKLEDLMAALPDQKRIVLSGIDMSQKDKRIKTPYSAVESGVGMQAVESVEAYRRPDDPKPLFKAIAGATSVKENQSYGHTGSLEIEVVAAGAPAGGK